MKKKKRIQYNCFIIPLVENNIATCVILKKQFNILISLVGLSHCRLRIKYIPFTSGNTYLYDMIYCQVYIVVDILYPTYYT